MWCSCENYQENRNQSGVIYYLSNTIPTASEQPGKIQAGDIMLYGDGCLVVFCETFSSSYNYTRLGYIEDAVSFKKYIGSNLNLGLSFSY
ncbi:cyclophilin-like fold protein [Clostridium sp.]|uniref:cyclophilin-like fold protein n=1 Tax=Clostridium sp. TaxID=1506 RepID=UPI003D6D19CA